MIENYLDLRQTLNNCNFNNFSIILRRNLAFKFLQIRLSLVYINSINK